MPGDKNTVEVPLRYGRSLAVTGQDDEQYVEIRGESGQIEIRIQMTDRGPVLRVESLRIALKAAESVDVECKDFRVNAEGIRLQGEADVEVTARGDVRVRGKMIYLN